MAVTVVYIVNFVTKSKKHYYYHKKRKSKQPMKMAGTMKMTSIIKTYKTVAVRMRQNNKQQKFYM